MSHAHTHTHVELYSAHLKAKESPFFTVNTPLLSYFLQFLKISVEYKTDAPLIFPMTTWLAIIWVAEELIPTV